MAGAPRGARGARGPPRGAARSRIARVFRRADPQRDCPAPGPAARHREDAVADRPGEAGGGVGTRDRKSTRLNSSHSQISYAVFCLKKKKKIHRKVSIFGM